MRRLVFALIALAIVAIVVIGLTQTGGSETPESSAPSAEEARERLAGSPATLAALHEQANELLPGGLDAFEDRLRDLRGHPVVVNGWASWCGPCRAEAPFLQRLSVDLGREVAFLGLDTEDNDDDARGFLEEFPVSYPSYTTPRIPPSRFGAIRGLPFMLFYTADGELEYVHQGGYRSEQQLRADIRRYALGETASQG
jgi:cytochrome c biogenesis protein CcmG/thiol:disulfide interchange protein DsbE